MKSEMWQRYRGSHYRFLHLEGEILRCNLNILGLSKLYAGTLKSTPLPFVRMCYCSRENLVEASMNPALD